MESVASPGPGAESGELHISQRLPVIHADLGPAARAAFGRWVAAVYGLVAHLDVCCFGCTAEMTRCFEGDAAVDDERSCWQSWRTANIAPSADGTTSWRDVRGETGS